MPFSDRQSFEVLGQLSKFTPAVVHLEIMGRRAKNKQADPPSIVGRNERYKPSAKKLGKRKQSPEPESRPTKKAKGKENGKLLKQKSKPKAKPSRKPANDSDASVWEDVDNDGDLELGTEQKYVSALYLRDIDLTGNCRALFEGSDEDAGFVGNLDDLSDGGDDE